MVFEFIARRCVASDVMNDRYKGVGFMTKLMRWTVVGISAGVFFLFLLLTGVFDPPKMKKEVTEFRTQIETIRKEAVGVYVLKEEGAREKLQASLLLIESLPWWGEIKGRAASAASSNEGANSRTSAQEARFALEQYQKLKGQLSEGDPSESELRETLKALEAAGGTYMDSVRGILLILFMVVGIIMCFAAAEFS
jgi:hypothetical protein